MKQQAANSSASARPGTAPLACPACESAAKKPLSGIYQFTCVQCCARLVLTAHPNKRQASALLAAILRFNQAPGRAEILECVRQHLTRLPSAGKKSGTD